MNNMKELNYNDSVKEAYSNIKVLAEKNNLSGTHGIFRTYVGADTTSNSILFVGRDTNGIDKNAESIGEMTEYDGRELTWLKGGYSYQKSPFLRVMGKINSAANGVAYNYDCFKQLYWSNLFKISPCARSKTSDINKSKQQGLCITLLHEEIKQKKPRGVVFLTGDELDPFLSEWTRNQLITDVKAYEGHYLKTFNVLVGQESIPAIALNHPQNKRGRTEEEVIDYATRFIENAEAFDEYIKKEHAVHQQLESIKSRLSANNGHWWIYKKRVIGLNDLMIQGHTIGIESRYSRTNNAMEIRYTTWNAKARSFFEKKLLNQVLSTFDLDETAVTAHDKKRIYVAINSLPINDAQTSSESDQNEVYEKLQQAHNYLLSLKEEYGQNG